MKKIISIMLTIIMCASCLVPVAFAETESQKFSFTDFKANNFEYTGINYERGMFGKQPSVGDTIGELSYVADFTGARNGDKGLMATSSFAPSAGSSIRISTKFAVDTDSVKDGAHLSMGLLTVNSTTPDNAGTETRFNPIYGSVVAGTNNIGTTVPTSLTLYKTPVKTWVTYEMVYDIIDDNGTKYIDKQSLYVDGQPVYTDHSLLSVKGNAKIPASTIYGIYYGERKRVAKVHFADMSLTYYPEGFDESQIDANPWTASGLASYFSKQNDGSYILTDLSLTDEKIAELGTAIGWTFSRVSYNDATDGEIEYIRMDKGDTTYFKKIISQDYISVKNVNFTDAVVTNTNGVYGGGLGMRYTGVTSQQNDTNSPLASSVLTTNPKSEDNDYINLSYKYLPNQLCGLAISDVPGSSSTYINGALTGRIAYEWSFMVDSFATNSIACRMYFNGTPGEKTITAYNRWIPFQVQNGYLRFNDDGTITKVRAPQTVLPGEWHHFVLVVDTNAKTLDIYQNGILIGTRQFTSADAYTINSINGMDIGVNNSGLPQVDVAHAVNLDDVRIGYVSADWTPETLAVTSKDESVTVNDVTSVILGDVTSNNMTEKLAVPENCTAVFSDGAVKVTDNSNLVIRYYKVAADEFALTGFDISTLTTDAGTKTLNVAVENNKADAYNAVLILASYDASGCLVDFDISKQVNVYAKQIKTLTAEINVTAEEPVKTFKAFLWENTDSITPLKPSLIK